MTAAATILPIRLLVVDDHPLLREGIAAVLKGQPDMALIAEAANGREAAEAYRLHRPDVTLMDVRMPDMGGIDALIAIRAESPSARIILLTTYKGDQQARVGLQSGAFGYLLKSTLRKDLLEAIRAVHAGRHWIPADVAMDVAEHAGEDVLSAREIQVLYAVAAGNSNKRVATELNISEETVKGHVKSILDKLDANDRTHAVTIALKRGIIAL